MSLNDQTHAHHRLVHSDAFLADREMRTRARMFLVSHMFGPILGNVIPAYPASGCDPGSRRTLAVLAGSICCFWMFPVPAAIHRALRPAFVCLRSRTCCSPFSGVATSTAASRRRSCPGSSRFRCWRFFISAPALRPASSILLQISVEPRRSSLRNSPLGGQLPAHDRARRHAGHRHHLDHQRLDLRLDDGALLRRDPGLAERVREGGAQASRDRRPSCARRRWKPSAPAPPRPSSSPR